MHYIGGILDVFEHRKKFSVGETIERGKVMWKDS